MSFKKITDRSKVLAIKELLAGGSVRSIADKYGVNRSSVYRWLDIYQKSLMENFSFSRQARDRAEIDNKLKNKIRILNHSLNKRNDEIESLKIQLEGQEVNDLRPARCKDCGCEKMYKNGIYSISLDRIIPTKVSCKVKIPVQRFACPACNSSSYLDYPQILYHWICSRDK